MLQADAKGICGEPNNAPMLRPYNDVAITPIVKYQSHNSKIFSKNLEIRRKICYNIPVLIKSGGGTGPVKPDNHLAWAWWTLEKTPKRCQIRADESLILVKKDPRSARVFLFPSERKQERNLQKKEARSTKSFSPHCQYGFTEQSAYIKRHITTIFLKAKIIKGKAEERR